MALPSKWNGSAEARQKLSLPNYSRLTEVTTSMTPMLMSENWVTLKN
jgi:hypothetical protein